MNIGFVAASASRRGAGVSEVVRHLSRALSALPDVRVTVFSLAERDTCEQDRGWGPVEVRTCPRRGPSAFGYAPALFRTLVDSDTDILHLHGLWMYTSVAGLRWVSRTRRPYVVSPHGMLQAWAVRNSRWKKAIAAGLYERRNFELAACVHALSTNEADDIRAFGVRRPVCVIPNGVCVSGALDRLERARGANLLLFLGRLHPKKNLPALLEGWASSRSDPRAAEWRLGIAGWDQDGHAQLIRRMAAALGVSDSVDFLGPQFGEAKAKLLAAASAFVLPSLSEGLPMAVLEAWAAGLPVLMTAACNLRQGFEAAAALRIGTDPISIRDGLLRLFGLSERERVTVGQRGRDLVIREFSWSVIANQMLEVYRWALGLQALPTCVSTI